MQYFCCKSPDTLRIYQAKGVVTGLATASAGRHVVTFLAENDHGKDERKLTFVVGDKFALTPPMGWNHWYTHYHFITDEVWILKKELADGSIAIGLLDLANQGDREISVSLGELGINQPCRKRDLWRRKDAGTIAEKLTVRVGPRGCAVLRLVAAKTPEP